MQQQTMFHRCGQRIDVSEVLEGGTNRFVYLDQQTGDGLERCPDCDLELVRADFHVQQPRAPRRRCRSSSATRREVARLLAQAAHVQTRSAA